MLLRRRAWSINLKGAMRPLPNPGSLCYIISVLYQLYMIPGVRESIERMKSARHSPTALKLQYLFKIMSECDGDIGDPVDEDLLIDLFETVQHAIGEADNIDMQKDASEFLLDLLTALRAIPDDENFAVLFLTGEYVNRLSADGGKLLIETPEKFVFLALEVEGFDSMEKSFQAYLQLETLPFKWKTGASNATSSIALPTEKSLAFKTLPQHLVIQLNRFKYDRARRRKVKINSRFSFPFTFDMAPFVPAEVSEGGCTYQLGGVVIHRGCSAHRGHYISFVRTRDVESKEWRAFDDDNIDPFGEEFLSEECFGRTELKCSSYDEDELADDDSRCSSSDTDGSEGENAPRSAMMLFYDRFETRSSSS